MVENVKKSFVHEGVQVPMLKGIDLGVEEREMVLMADRRHLDPGAYLMLKLRKDHHISLRQRA